MGRRYVGVLVGAASLLALTGCSRGLAVPLPDPLPEGSAAYACADLTSSLPEQLLGQNVVATDPQSALINAWGDPAIVTRCGVPTPAALTPTSQLLTVDGVDWLPEQLERGYLFTTVGRSINVEVSVPDAYSPEADALVDISAAVRETIPAS
ncbi:MAG: DUF3515 domain-containing protein [Candidatus Nanopelagicales bacterium]